MTNNFFRLTFIYAFVGLILEFGIIAVNAIECGTTDFARTLILKGTQTQRGEYPFIAALYLVEDRKFICGGSLISAKHVLTAAHCTKGHGIILVPIDLIVLLGSYDLTSRIERGAVQRDVTEIRVHPDWKVYSGKYDADLSILVLSEIVAFTNFIRPVCLPADDSVIPGARGTIVGWGLSDNGTEPHLIYPKHAMTTALNDSYCYTTDFLIASYSSLRTFCGGGEETSPSQGDSGGGFFVRHGSVWLQYGIISAIRSNASGYVDANSFAVYTNVKDFKTWIKNTVRQSGGEVGEGITMDKDTVRQSESEVGEGNGMDKTKIQLNCRYSKESYISSLYGCDVYDLNIRTNNFEVASFTGTHQDGKTDEDVEDLLFVNGTMFYLPDGIGNNFKNLKFLTILEGLDTLLITRSNFKYLKSLKQLKIDDNNIETLEEDTLWDLPHLVYFIIYNNKLRKFKEETFVNNPELRFIRIYANQLESIPRNLFQKNFLLEDVSLPYNKLTTIDEGTFVNNPNLKEVTLQGNHLEFLPATLFRNNLLLKGVDFSYNSIKIIKIDFTFFKYLEFANFYHNLCINDNFNNDDDSDNDKILRELQPKIRTSCSSVNIP